METARHATDAKEVELPSGRGGQAILLVDEQATILGASPSAEILVCGSGGAPAGICGRQLADVLEAGADDVERLIRSGSPVVCTSGDGSTIVVESVSGLRMPSTNAEVQVLSLRLLDGLPAGPGRWDDTVAVLGHEIKTPITAIIGALRLIDGGAVGDVPAEAGDLIRMALRNARRAHAMIRDLLEAEAMDDGNLSLQPTDLAQVVRQSIGACRGVAAAMGVELRLNATEEPLQVLGDAERLERAVENLISNATKFSDKGKVVEVSLDRRDEWVRVTVADTGPGIPAFFQPFVFQKFAKHDFEDGRNREGTGLGLAIAKSIVDAHSGRIGFSSRPGDTRFWVDLPAWRDDDSA